MAQPSQTGRSGMNRIFHFKDDGLNVSPDPIFDYPDSLRDSHCPVVIDNGSFKCRVGWATDDKPRIIFKNLVARQRGKKDADVPIGNDMSNLEVVRWQLKTQFERNVVTHYDTQESVFDYIFGHLGINTVGSVEHPVVMTEPFSNPNYCRQQMSELLFEGYHVPGVVYGVDSLFSLHQNYPDVSDCLVLSCGYHSLHVIPMLNGRLQASHTRRINMGGYHVDNFMQKLLQLKYPGHMASLTLTRAEELTNIHCRMAVDYQNELKQWACEDFYMSNVHIMELPHTVAAPVPVNPEQQRERKENQAKRLRDINARRREEKLAEDQEKLQSLLVVLEMQEEDEDAFNRALTALGYTDAMELNMAINKLNNAINKLNNKLLGEDDPDVPPKPKVAKEEKKQTTLLQQLENMRNQEQVDLLIADIKRRRQELLDVRAKRKQRKQDMAKRRTLAAQERMKIITELAQGTRRKKEDTFGKNDDDWNVYKQINKDAGDSDSETEQERLDEWENALRVYDPTFVDPNAEELAAPIDPKEYYRLYVGVERIRIPELMFQPSMIGMEQAGLAETIEFVLNKFSPEDQNKLVQHIFLTGGCASFPNLRKRLEKELLSMRPFKSTFKVYGAKDPVLDAWHGARKHIFLTGGCASFPNLRKRLEKELLSMRPFKSTFKVYGAKDPVLDAWHGARKVALSPQLQNYSITKEDYEEKGMEYLREHPCSNRYFASPVVEMRRSRLANQLAADLATESNTESNDPIFESNTS